MRFFAGFLTASILCATLFIFFFRPFGSDEISSDTSILSLFSLPL